MSKLKQKMEPISAKVDRVVSNVFLPGKSNTMRRRSIPSCVSVEDLSRQILPCLLDLGEALLVTGADVNLVERLIRHVGYAYGAAKMNVLVITASIIVTLTLPNGREYTQTRRVETAGSTDFAKLEKLTRLCSSCVREPVAPKVLRARLKAILDEPFPRLALYLGGILAAAFFAVFFGGSPLDAVVAGIFAIFSCWLLEYFKPYTPNTIAFNFVASFLSGIGIGLLAHVLPGLSIDMAIIGIIMLLIPGVAMTNATRDMISGDTISGVMRFIESLLWATALVLGFMAALLLTGAGDLQARVTASPTIQLIMAVPATLGFALFFNVRKGLIPWATLGGLLTEGIYLIGTTFVSGGDVFMPCLAASVFAAFYAEVLSRVFRAPTSIFFIISVIPLIPGRGLFYTMKNAVQTNWVECGSFALLTLQYAVAIAIGITIVWACVQTWQNWRDQQILKRHGDPLVNEIVSDESLNTPSDNS